MQFCPFSRYNLWRVQAVCVSTILGTARAGQPVAHRIPSVPLLCSDLKRPPHSWALSWLASIHQEVAFVENVFSGLERKAKRKRRQVVVWRFVCLVVYEFFCLFIFPLWLNGGEWHIITLHGRENISQALVWICQSVCVCTCVFASACMRVRKLCVCRYTCVSLHLFKLCVLLAVCYSSPSCLERRLMSNTALKNRHPGQRPENPTPRLKKKKKKIWSVNVHGQHTTHPPTLTAVTDVMTPAATATHIVPHLSRK